MQSDAQQDVESFCADVVNAVQDYCDDGIDAFENCLVNAPQLDEQTRQRILEGSSTLHQDLTTKVAGSLALFVELCKSSVLQTPLPLQWPQPSAPESDKDLEDLQQRSIQLDQRLEALRKQIITEDEECSRLAERLQEMDARICLHGGVTSVQAVASTLGSDGSGGTVAGDVAAITAAQRRLQPLLSKAWTMTAQQTAQAKIAGPGQLRVASSDRILLGSVENIMPFP